VGDNVTFTIYLQKDLTGHMTYVIREFIEDEVTGDEYYRDITAVDVPIINGTARYTKTNVSVLDYNCEEVFKYVGEERIPEVGISYAIGMGMAMPKEISVGESSDIAISLPDDANGTITVVIDEKYNFTVEVKNGKANIPLGVLPQGEHTVDMQYNGNYGQINSTGYVSVDKLPVNATIANVAFKDTTTSFDVVLSAPATGKLVVLVDQLTFEKDIKDGKISISADDLGYGKRTVLVIYAGDGNYSGFSQELSISVPYPKITSKVSSVVYAFGSYSVTVYGIDGKVASGVNVVFKINGKKIGSAKTNKKGVASIKIKKAPKKYKITAEALKVKFTKKVTVKHALTLKTVKVKKSAKKLVLTATLKNGKKPIKSKKITFKFNGKKLTAKTNKKGVAKVTVKKAVLKKLKVGKKVKYQATYLKDTVKKSVKVKK
jgi:hypothetical protein